MGTDSYVLRLKSDSIALWKDRNPLLRSLDIELTERCNNNCIHCYINLPLNDIATKSRELSTDEIKDILREAANLGCITVRYTGGEPLARDDFSDLYFFARKLGLRVMIFTNGTLITEQLAKLFAHIPPLEKMEITLYGMNEKSYEAVSRVPGSFESAWRGVNLLLDNRVPFMVKSAFLPSNRNEIEEFESWTSTIPWMDKPPSYSTLFSPRCRHDSKDKDRLIKFLRPSLEERFKLLSRRSEERLKWIRQFCRKFMGPPGDRLFSCGAGLSSGCVDAYGHFQPCMLVRHPDTIYNLESGSIKDALINFFPGVRDIKATNPDYLARCSHCFLKGLCEQCPAKSWMEHGTLDTPVEYLCEVAHADARQFGLIKDNEKAWEVIDWRERIEAFSG